MTEFIIDLSILIFVATAFAVLLQFIRQPPLIAYIIAGLVLSQFGIFSENETLLKLLGDFGIILLLYIAGLEIQITKFIKLGKETLAVGEGHDIIMGVAGFGIGIYFLGLDVLPSIYLGLALTLSSTIVVVKALAKRRELAAPHGRILMGTMLLQDMVAMGSIAIFTSLAHGGNPWIEIAKTVGMAIGLFIVLTLIGRYVVEKFFYKLANSIEMVFLVGLTWCFGAVLLAHYIGFSIEIAAFIAGMSIAHLPFSFEIKDKTRSLQDFGLLLFFFAIGAKVTLDMSIYLSWKFVLLTIFVLAATPIISGTINSFLRMDRKKNFLISVMPIQVSEFSIVLMAIGLKLGQVSEELFSLVVAITVVTIMFSSAFLNNLNPIYKKVGPHLRFLEWRKLARRHHEKPLKNHIVIFGFGRMGEMIVDHYKGRQKVVIEWDPQKIERAKAKKCHIIFGDAGDPDIWEEAALGKANLVISTIVENMDDDINLGKWIRKNHPQTVSVAVTGHKEEVGQLKRAGYDFVLWQDEAGWSHLKKYLDTGKIKKRVLKKS